MNLRARESRAATTVKGNEDGKPATVQQLAALEFGAIKELARMPEEQRRLRVNELAENLRVMTLIASEIVAHDKAKLIDLVKKKYDVLGPSLMDLARAADDAQALLDVIRSAESRLAVALAVVEGDD